MIVESIKLQVHTERCMGTDDAHCVHVLCKASIRT